MFHLNFSSPLTTAQEAGVFHQLLDSSQENMMAFMGGWLRPLTFAVVFLGREAKIQSFALFLFCSLSVCVLEILQSEKLLPWTTNRRTLAGEIWGILIHIFKDEDALNFPSSAQDE